MIRFLLFQIFFNNFIFASPAISEEDLRFANVTILDFDEQAVSFEDLQRTHGLHCDEDQCQNKWACPANSECINKCAKYVCQCKKGFFKSGSTCIPADKCDEDQCLRNPCPVQSRCQNRCSGFECLCEKGKWNFESSSCELQCPPEKEEVNGECVYKCEKTKCDCGVNEICIRAVDFRKCTVKKCRCRKGFSRKGAGNECQKDCPVGHKLEGKICKKICNKNAATCNCSENEFCSVSSDENGCDLARCSCRNGFEMKNGFCQKICSERKCADVECGAFSVCEETCAGPICGCMPGYRMEKGDCARNFAKERGSLLLNLKGSHF